MPKTTTEKLPTPPTALRLVHPRRDPDEVQRWRLEERREWPLWRPRSNNAPYRVSTDE